MYNAFWRLALFLRGQSFSVKTFDRSRNGCQVIREGAGNDFRGPSVQALPLPSRVSFSRARFFFCPLLASACYAGYVRRENYSKTRMFVIKDSPVCLALDNFSEKGANENGNYDT